MPAKKKPVKDTPPPEAPQPPQLVSMVAVPTEVFQLILAKLGSQPYDDVRELLNVLHTYKAQLVSK